MPCRGKTVVASAFPHIDAAKEGDFWEWYRQTLSKGGMTDQHPSIPGHFVLQPPSYTVWEKIRAFLGNKLKRMGVQDCAFPLYKQGNVTPRDSDRDTEKSVETGVGDQPTAASVVYPCYARWITSFRDLPIRLNQWTLGFSQEAFPQPLLRCREFLKHEAYTAHLTQHDAYDEIRQVLEIYTAMYKELLAIPVVRGQQGSNENRASAGVTDVDEVNTAVVVGYIPSLGQCIQGGVCRGLGQSFSRQYAITIPDPPTDAESDAESLLHVWQNSWSLSIRAIGLMIATHSDNLGLVLPPRVAEVQVVIIPLQYARNEPDHQKLHAEIESIQSTLSSRGVRVTAHLCDWRSVSWKLLESVTHGVPLRLCLGSEELAGEYVTAYRRDLPRPEGETRISISDLPNTIPVILEDIQDHLFKRARDIFNSCQKQVTDWDDFIHVLCTRETTSTICLAPYCLNKACEQRIEVNSRSPIKCLCVPWEQPDEIEERGIFKCINPDCAYRARKWAMFGYTC